MENETEMGSQKKPNDLLLCRKELDDSTEGMNLEATDVTRPTVKCWSAEEKKINNYLLNYATIFVSSL